MEALPPALLLLLLQLSESVLIRHEFVRTGAGATLPCENLRPGQVQCEGTTWSFSHSRSSVEVVRLGQLSSSLPHLQNRFRTTDNCSLEIKEVRLDEAGHYSCQQYDRSGTGPALEPDTLLTLSVVSVTEERSTNHLELWCHVSTALSSSSVSVTWRVQGRCVDQELTGFNPSTPPNSARIAVPRDHVLYRNQQRLRCAVSHGGQTHLFNVSSIISEPTPTAAPPTSKRGADGGDEEQRRCGSCFEGLVLNNTVLTVLMFLTVLMSALLLIVTVLLTWTKPRGLRTQRNRTSVSSGVYEIMGTPCAAV